MLRIVISPRKLNIKDVEGEDLNIFPLLIPDGEKVVYLQHCDNLPEVTKIELWRVPKYLPYAAGKINLPARTEAAIIKFLNLYHRVPEPNFDCYSFACMAYGMSVSPKAAILKHWETRRLFLRPRRGDAVFLVREEGKRTRFCHAALYLEYGLYLSVYGAGGHLEVSTLQDMKKDFGATRAFRVMPRKQTAA